MKTAELVLLPGQIDGTTENYRTDINLKTTDNGENACKPAETYRRQPSRKAAIKAREKIANLSTIRTNKPKQNTPLHGWDYDRMLELWMLDTDDAVLYTHTLYDYDNEVILLNQYEDQPEDPNSDQSGLQ